MMLEDCCYHVTALQHYNITTLSQKYSNNILTSCVCWDSKILGTDINHNHDAKSRKPHVNFFTKYRNIKNMFG